MVRAADRLTFNVKGTTGGLVLIDAGDLRSGVIDALTKNFSGVSVDIKIGSLLDMIQTGQLYHWDYSAFVGVTLRGDYGTAEDIGSIVANAFYNAGGALPTVQVASAPGNDPGIDYGADLLEQLGAPLQKAGLVLVLGLIAIVALIVFSPAGREAGRSVGKIRVA